MKIEPVTPVGPERYETLMPDIAQEMQAECAGGCGATGYGSIMVREYEGDQPGVVWCYGCRQRYNQRRAFIRNRMDAWAPSTGAHPLVSGAMPEMALGR